MKNILRSLLAVPVIALGAMMLSSGSANTDGSVTSENNATAIFAGGCFWCVESDFDKVPGVLETVSGYSGGETDNPTYKNHHQGRHREVVQITYDPAQVSYEQLLHVFWRSVDPTDIAIQQRFTQLMQNSRA